MSQSSMKDQLSSIEVPLRIVDLFAGLGGTRIGVEQACKDLGVECTCVLASDKKKASQVAYKHNFMNKEQDHDLAEEVFCDNVLAIDEKTMPDFDMLLGGFPCQPFSRAGMKRGFSDTRGTMFFEIERILKEKQPRYVLLENVPEITTNDKGNTIRVIREHLEALGYGVAIDILNGQDFGLAQSRRRAFITGIKDHDPLDFSTVKKANKTKVFGDIQEEGLPALDNDFTKAVLSSYKAEDLAGYVVNDKRRGDKTLHSWDFGLKGSVSEEEKHVLETSLSEFRRKTWAKELGVQWRDGMPLNLEQLSRATKYDEQTLEPILEGLVDKGYMMKRHPYANGSLEERTDLPVGYKLITSRVSFELNRFLGPNDLCVTLTATDASHIGVIDGDHLRRLSIREGLRLFGFPDEYDLSCVNDKEAYDLIGNSICVPVVKAVAKAMFETIL